MGAIIIFVTVLSSSAIRQFLCLKPVEFLGKISFPLYLLHCPILITVYCGTFVLLNGAQSPSALIGLLSITVYVAVSLLVAGLLTPIMDGGSIYISNRIAKLLMGRSPNTELLARGHGDAIDTQRHAVAAVELQHLKGEVFDAVPSSPGLSHGNPKRKQDGK